jgi:hypothetical protein
MNLEAMQVLIDQGRKVWLWPDKDGREQWQAVCDKLGSDCVNVFTKFFDSCWVPEDGDKADVADIAIRMMRTGDKPRKEEPEPETIVKWEGEQPFLDAEELFNPRLHEMRMIMSRCHSKKWLKAHHLEIVDDDEIIKRYPILEPLLNNENYEQTET